MRKISFKLLTQSQLETIETDARTLRDLEKVIINGELADKINLGKVKFVDKATYAEYGNIPEAVLPSIDCILFVTPINTKSGADITPENFLDFDEEALAEFFNELGYNELRTFGSQLNRTKDAGISLHDKRDDILQRILDYVITLKEFQELENSFSEVFVDAFPTNNKDILLDAISLIERVIVNLKETEDVATSITCTELQTEANRLRDLLNNK